MKSDKLYILCIEQKKLLKSVQQFNEFNKVIKKNEYYIYEFLEFLEHLNLTEYYLIFRIK